MLDIRLLLIKKTTNSLNLQMMLTKFRIKSGSQCQWLTFSARLVVNCLRRLILAWVTDPTAAASEARTGAAFLPNGVTTQREGLLARGPPGEGNYSSHGVRCMAAWVLAAGSSVRTLNTPSAVSIL